MIRRALLVAVPLVACSCVGATNRGDLMILVQRVELLPGVDALDPIDPTPVGQDLRRIRFYFTEPLSPATVAAFDPATHLELDGLSLDPANPPQFNSAPLGLIPARGRLTLTLDPGSDGLLSEGTYHLKLKSPESSPLVAELSGTPFDGSFRFTISVNARDGKLPYLVRFRAGDVVVGEEISANMLIGVMEEGIAVAPTPIPPHARLAAEFSERMRAPVPFAVTPVLHPALELVVQKEDGTTLTLATKTIAYPGISFDEKLQVVRWTDTVDSIDGFEIARLTTVLASETDEGMEVDTPYTVRFAGFSGGLSTQSVTRDRSGEPLTVRVENGAEYRDDAKNDRRAFRTSPIRINAPTHRSTLNRAAFGGMPLDLAVSGEVTDAVASIEASIRRDGVTIVAPVAVSPTVVDETNRLGAPINHFAATVTLPATVPDGDYEVVAESFAFGAAREVRDRRVGREHREVAAREDPGRRCVLLRRRLGGHRQGRDPARPGGRADRDQYQPRWRAVQQERSVLLRALRHPRSLRVRAQQLVPAADR